MKLQIATACIRATLFATSASAQIQQLRNIIDVLRQFQRQQMPPVRPVPVFPMPSPPAGSLPSVMSPKPTFDCSKAHTPLALILCSQDDAAKADWDLTAASWAYASSLEDSARKSFWQGQDHWITSVTTRCKLSVALSAQQRQCVVNAYRIRANALRARLKGDALAETTLTPEQRMAIQARLVSLGVLNDEPDGEFGPNTRIAIRKFQEANGFSQSDYLTADQRQMLVSGQRLPAPDSTLSQPKRRGRPSFDCAKARAPDGNTICSDLELSQLDNGVAVGYEYARGIFGELPARQINTPLFRARQACGADAACIKENQIAAIVKYRDLGAPVNFSVWDHNGSIVELVANGRFRSYFYKTPRAEMLSAGAKPGSLLFEGEAAGDQYVGVAYFFDSRCGPIPYQVSGPVLENYERVVLQGLAPRIAQNCLSQGYASETLEFKPVKAPQPVVTPPKVQPDAQAEKSSIFDQMYIVPREHYDLILEAARHAPSGAKRATMAFHRRD